MSDPSDAKTSHDDDERDVSSSTDAVASEDDIDEEADEASYDEEDGDDEEEAFDDPSSDATAAPPSPPRAMRGIELFGLSVLCIAMGGMLAGAALGVMEAARGGGRPPPVVTASLGGTVGAQPERDGTYDAAGSIADATSQEANPEETGDGVMDDIDEAPPPQPPGARTVLRASTTPGEPAAAPQPPTPTSENVRLALTAGDRRSAVVVNSDHVPEGPAQGYVHGRAIRIYVERLDNKPVERHTAAAYRRMRDAALRDHVTLRIASGFRTMEHQQALYRAYRRGRGNLAAPPGYSNHQSGHALDLNTSSPGVLRWLERNGRRFGFRRTVPTEPWHWEWW